MEDSNTTTSVEINFRLDAHGRTTLPQAAPSTDATATTMTKKIVMDYTTRFIDTSVFLQDNGNNNDNKNSQNHLYFPSSISNNKTSNSSSWYDDVLLDCEMADSGLMPRTFWVPAAAAAATFKPRCTLEQWALDIFHHHVNPRNNNNNNKKGKNDNNHTDHDDGCCSCEYDYDPMTSGAEWWVQIRPQLNAQGRYEMHANPGDYDKNGICFHWDKDEDLRLACGGNLYIHPHLSTVTYLTSHGAPTMVVEHARIHNILGTWILPSPPPPPITTLDEMDETEEQQEQEECQYCKSFISWPSAGKHLCFDGRYLHAAPSNLAAASWCTTTTTNHNKNNVSCSSHIGDLQTKQHQQDETAVQDTMTTKTMGTTTDASTKSNHQTSNSIMTREEKRQARRGRRMTFLVNIWLNYKPLNVEPFPETMLDKMSGSRNFCPASSCSDSAAAPTSSSSSSSTCPPAPALACLRFGKVCQDHSNDSKEVVEEEEACSFETTSVTIANGKVVSVVPPQQEAATTLVETFTWPMGNNDSGESIQMQIPLNLVKEHQAQLDTSTNTTNRRRRRRRRGGNIHIHYVPSTSSTTLSEPTLINNLGVVLLKNDDAINNSNIDDDSPQPREKRTTRLNDDDNDNSCCAKRPHSDKDNNK